MVHPRFAFALSIAIIITPADQHGLALEINTRLTPDKTVFKVSR